MWNPAAALFQEDTIAKRNVEKQVLLSVLSQEESHKWTSCRERQDNSQRIILLLEPGKIVLRMHPDLPCSAWVNLAFQDQGFSSLSVMTTLVSVI